MKDYVFPASWDSRALEIVEDYVDQAFDDIPFTQILNMRLENWYQEDLQSISYFSDLLLAVSMIFAWDSEKRTPKLASFLKENPLATNLMKDAFSFASEIGHEFDLGDEDNDRSLLGVLHKAIVTTLFEALIEDSQSRRLTLRNDSSEFVLLSDGRKLGINFQIDGHADGGAATITCMMPEWLQISDISDESNNGSQSIFVSERYCSGFDVIYNYDELDTAEIVQKLSKFYQAFRSIGTLHIEMEIEENSAWNLVLSALQTLAPGLQMTINEG